MLNKAQRAAVFGSIPNQLCGKTIPKYISDQYINAPGVPNIGITYLTQGSRARWSSSPITFVLNDLTKDWDERWGQIHKATISIVINDYDKTELFDFAADMLNQIFHTRLGLVWATDRVKFIDVISEPIMQSVRLEQDKKILHRAHIDIWIEYEVAWWLDEVSIHRIGYEVNDRINGMMYEPGGYGASLRLVNSS